MVKLSKRMEAVASYVNKCSCAADCGCDHGYLSISLVERNLAQHCYAMDINKGPLERAKEHILEANLNDRIDTILCDGLTGIEPGSVDTIIIAGMGGPLMEKILTESKAVADAASSFVLQPQSDIGNFRRFLVESDYVIDRETIVFEEGKFYPVLHVCHGKSMNYTDCEYEYGKMIDDSAADTLKDYISYRISLFARILDTLDTAGNSPRIEARVIETRKELNLAFEALKRFPI